MSAPLHCDAHVAAWLAWRASLKYRFTLNPFKGCPYNAPSPQRFKMVDVAPERRDAGDRG